MKYLPLILRNLKRNRLRSFLTGMAISLAVALVSFLQTMPAGLDRLLSDVASNTRISVHNEAGLVYSMPYAYLNKIRAVPGVVEAASWTWFGGVFEEEKGIAFPNFMVEPDAVATVFDRRPQAQSGKSDETLSAAAAESFIRGTISVVLYTLFEAPLEEFALKFGPPE